jgi:hypothetical protein
MTFQQYAIAPNFNNAANLVLLDSIMVNNRPFIVQGIGRYSTGELNTNANGRASYIGYPSIFWAFTVLLYAQFEHLNTTYCNGDYSGDVTIRTRLDSTSYSNFNAVMTLPQSKDVNKRLGAYIGVEIPFTRLEAL